MESDQTSDKEILASRCIDVFKRDYGHLCKLKDIRSLNVFPVGIILEDSYLYVVCMARVAGGLSGANISFRIMDENLWKIVMELDYTGGGVSIMDTKAFDIAKDLEEI